jgi:uncharacterized membrane protein YhaH (DUF805 family)
MNWYLGVFKKYADFNGRACRSEFWYFTLFNFLALVILAGIGTQVSFFYAIYFIYALGALIPNLAVSVRRLHDIGKSGFWLFIVLVPLIGALVLLYFQVQPSQSSSNDYGAVPR